MSVSQIYQARQVAAVANGIFAGLGLTLNLVGVPALRAVKQDAVSAWAVVYNNGARLGIPLIFISSAAHFFVYYKTRTTRSLVTGLLSLASFPYTLIFMKPTNDRLHAINDSSVSGVGDAAKSSELIDRWDSLQWFRTTSGTLAFLLTVFQ